MSTRVAAAALAVLGGFGALAMPSASQAGNVGYVAGQTCSGPGDKSAAIAAAGHTAVAINTISPASLSGLSALVVETCSSYSSNADITAAVNAGMGLLISDWGPGTGTGAQLPGAPAISYTVNDCVRTTDFPAGSPAATGLTNASLDGGNCSAHGYLDASTLPGNVTVLTTSDAGPTQAISLMYQHGAGKVVYAPLPWSWFLPGGSGAGNGAAPGIGQFMINSIGLVAGTQLPATTCASEGYTGTKLTWCQNVCEKGYTGAQLDSWIHRWTSRYRDLPYCAVEEEEPEEELPPQV